MIHDPHNLGACLRTAWLLGAQAFFIPENRASPLTPTAMKVASGGAEHVPVVIDGNLLDAAKSLKDKAYWLFAVSYTHLRAHETVLDIVCRLLLDK